MSLVSGVFPGFNDARQIPRRAPVNPLDKSTVVSIYPFEVDERKETIQPGRFIIPPGSYEHPSLLVVGPSSWWRDVDVEQPLLEIPTSSIQIADSIVADYCKGLLACDMQNSKPGLFYIPGQVTVKEVVTNHKKELDRAYQNQRNWYAALVKFADSMWSRSNGNPLAISDNMRIAARELGFNTKEWLQDFQNVEMVRCVACGSMRNPLYPICPTCKAVVDVEKAKSLNLKFSE